MLSIVCQWMVHMSQQSEMTRYSLELVWLSSSMTLQLTGIIPMISLNLELQKVDLLLKMHSHIGAEQRGNRLFGFLGFYK